MLLVRVEPPLERIEDGMFGPRLRWPGVCEGLEDMVLEIVHARCPHAPGDLIPIGTERCTRCDGCGTREPWEESPAACSACEGSGEVAAMARVLEVLPPVRVEDVTEEEAREAGLLRTEQLLWVLGLMPTDWVWRVRVKLVDSTKGE